MYVCMCVCMYVCMYVCIFPSEGLACSVCRPLAVVPQPRLQQMKSFRKSRHRLLDLLHCVLLLLARLGLVSWPAERQEGCAPLRRRNGASLAPVVKDPLALPGLVAAWPVRAGACASGLVAAGALGCPVCAP